MRQEIEASLLFLAMIAPESIALSGCSPDDFSTEVRGAIWAAMDELAEEGVKLLTGTAVADRCGIPIDVVKWNCALPTIVEPEPEKAEEFGRQLRDWAARDRITEGFTDLLEMDHQSAQELAAAALEIIGSAGIGERENAMTALEEAEELIYGGSNAIATGWTLWDRMMGGLPIGFNTIIAGRPGQGKTALMIALFDQLTKRGIRCCYYSLEESRAQAMVRWIVVNCLRSASLFKVMMGNATAFREEIDEAMRTVHALPGTIVGKSWRNIGELAFDIRRRRESEGLQVAFVDHITIAKSPSARKQGGRVAEVEHCSRKLRETAKETQVAVVVGSQLKKQEGNPTLNDLKQSGAIEEDAAAIVLLHKKGGGFDSGPIVPVILDLAKNRYGPTEEFFMGFEKRRATFVEDC